MSNTQKKKLEDKLNGIKRKITNCVNLMAETGSSALIEKLNQLESEKKEIERQISSIELDNNLLSEDVIRNYLLLLKSQDFNDENVSRKLLQHFVNRVEVSKKNAVITYNVTTATVGTTRKLLVD